MKSVRYATIPGILVLLILLPGVLSRQLEAAIYTVGGLSRDYFDLDALFLAESLTPFLADGDVIILYSNDYSMNNRVIDLGGISITIQSNDGTPRTIRMFNPGSPPFDGGIMQFDTGGTLVLNNIIFSDGIATGDGGAIWAWGTLELSGNGNYAFTGNQANGSGGAIYASTSLNFSGNGVYEFTRNQADGAGGAIASTSLNFSGNGVYEFTENIAGEHGGAISASYADFSNDGNYTFTGNQADGWGGAIYSHNSLNFSGNGNYAFTGNQAGMGGAILTFNGSLNISGNGNYLFSGNQAGTGGAIVGIYGPISFSGDGKYTFTGNQASGSGGAIFVGDSHIFFHTGVTFTDNHALSGGGGAIAMNFSYNGNLTIKAMDTPNGSVLFQGNTMNSVLFGEIPNSIFVGSNATLNFDVAANAKFEMFDPMAGSGNVNITKTGEGTWLLAGHNDMRGSTNWKIDEGNLFLTHYDYGNGTLVPTHIDLSGSSSVFTLANGAGLIVEPGLVPHKITSPNILLNAGSTVGLSDSLNDYTHFAPGEYVVLKLERLEGGVPSGNGNYSSIPVNKGHITSGSRRYRYDDLYWDDDLENLIMVIGGSTFDPERGGVPAMTGPGVIRHHSFNIFDRRFKDLLGSCCDNTCCSDSQNHFRSNLWGTQSYVHATRSAHENEAGFDLKMPAVTFGYDRRFNRYDFLGIGATLGWPEYSAHKTNIKANDMTIALYGGTKVLCNIEMTARTGYGYARFKQVRGVEDEWYGSQYDGHTFFAGLGVSRLYSLCNPRFCVRPGLNHDYIHLMTDGFREKEGMYALHVDDHSQSLHRLKIGVDLNWQPRRWFQASTEVYYLGMYGDLAAEAGAYFVNDPVNKFTTTGSPLDQNNLGLGMNLRLPFNRWELGAGYTALFARDTTSQQASLTAVYRF